MLLVIDVGNTNIVLGLFRGDELHRSFRVSTRRSGTADEYLVLLRSLFDLHSIDVDDIDDAVLASVVPQTNRSLTRVLEHLLGKAPLIVGPGITTGMKIRTDQPHEVGADRIVNSVAAWHRFNRALIVVDFGTATTFDAVDHTGAYRGGAIAPGMDISMDALFQAASKLPRVEVRQPDSVIGRNTVNAMQSGLFFGYVGLVEGLVRRMREALGDDVLTVATGGLAGQIAAACDAIDEVDDGLTLRGLRILHELNR